MKTVLGIAIFLVSICLVSSRLVAHENKKEIIIGGDIWCPYNCVPGSEKPGYIVEIVRNALEEEGYVVVYKMTSWDIAVKSVSDGTLTGVVGSHYIEERPVVYTRYPLGESYNVYVVRSDFITPESKIDYNNLKIGVLLDYVYNKSSLGVYLKKHAHAENVSYITSSKGVVHNLERLVGGDIDITLADKKVVVDILNKYPKLAAELKIIHPHDTDKNKVKLYAAFSKKHKNAEHLARIVDRYLLKSVYSGKLEEILKKYHLTQEDYKLFKGLK